MSIVEDVWRMILRKYQVANLNHQIDARISSRFLRGLLDETY